MTRGLGALVATMAIVISACTPAAPGATQSNAPAPTVGATTAAPATSAPTATTAAPATTAPAETTPAAPAETTPAASETPGESPSESPAAGAGTKACMVSDVGGIDDKGFNANAYKGLQDAGQELGLSADQVKFLESKSGADYQRNLATHVSDDCFIIVTVGFLLGDDTSYSAQVNPDQAYTIVDFAYDPPLENVLGLTFKTDEAAMLAGYLAAGMSKTGKVGTFGGINIPPVTIFMDGLAAGINYYNKQKGTNVELLGWTPSKDGGTTPGEGTFTGDFEDKDKGKTTTETLIQEGADIIVPVAGPVGLGAAAAVQDAKADGVMLIGVDTDQYVSAPEYGDVTLTSILKRIDNAVKTAVVQAKNGEFQGGVYSGTLQNEGVGLAPFHDFEDKVPAELKTEITTLQGQIAGGEVKVADFLQPAP
jgi:basic membrane protein A